MRGKQILMESLLGHGVEYIFGNPGTTESPILDALLDYPQLRYVVALHEGVALAPPATTRRRAGGSAWSTSTWPPAWAMRSGCSTTRSRRAPLSW